MRPRESLTDLLRRKRPVLRVQLALLYSGVFIGLVVALFSASSLLFGTANVFFGHAEVAYRPGAAGAASGGATRDFSPGPFLIALAIVALALALAWWLAGRFLHPLRAMTATAREISATNLGGRLALDGPDDELTELGRTLNDLFGRLQGSFESQRRFVANASHELRTPLAAQKTLLQVALADPAADATDLRSTCEEALQLSSQQERLTESLLTLAVSERGVESWKPVDLLTLTTTVVASREQDAARRELRIDTSLDRADVIGDPSLLECLITNLVDNAIRHNVPGGTVEIATETTPAGSRLTVTNTGPEVPAGDLDRLFQPFQRLAGQRLGSGDGHGLGLAIVQSVVTAHAATLIARPRPHGGLAVTITFRSVV